MIILCFRWAERRLFDLEEEMRRFNMPIQKGLGRALSS